MTNHITTAATSHALKEAGFPQPAIETGQFWYDKKGSLFVVTGKSPHWRIVNMETGESPLVDLSEIERDYAYAPCATEIMALPSMHCVDVQYYPFIEQWRTEEDDGRIISEPNPNPAECAAAEYLKLKNQ